jgi:phage gp36-like protein
MYLNISDLKKGMRAEVIETVTRNDCKVVAQAIEDAATEVESYLSARYDIAAELQKDAEQTDRIPMTVKLVRDIALYNIYNYGNPANIPPNRIKGYDGAIAFLKSLQAEKANIPGLQRLNAGAGGTSSSFILFGGNEKRSNYI